MNRTLKNGLTHACIISSISLTSATAWASHEADDTLYVANKDTNSVDIYDVEYGSRGTLVDQVAVCNKPSRLAVLPSGGTAFVACEDQSVWALSPYTGRAWPLVVGTSNPDDIVVHPSGDQLFVAGIFDGYVTVVDVATQTITQQVPASKAQELAVTSDGASLYILSRIGELSVMDTATYAVKPLTADIGSSPSSLEIANFGDQLYITRPSHGYFVSVETQCSGVLQDNCDTVKWPVGGMPTDMVEDPLPHNAGITLVSRYVEDAVSWFRPRPEIGGGRTGLFDQHPVVGAMGMDALKSQWMAAVAGSLEDRVRFISFSGLMLNDAIQLPNGSRPVDVLWAPRVTDGVRAIDTSRQIPISAPNALLTEDAKFHISTLTVTGDESIEVSDNCADQVLFGADRCLLDVSCQAAKFGAKAVIEVLLSDDSGDLELSYTVVCDAPTGAD